MDNENGKYVSDSASEVQQFVLPNDTNILGNLLGGRVMEWVDMVGAMVACRHSRRPVVTASMDRLDFHHPIKLGDIVILKTELNYVGKTSMEVSVSIFSENLGQVKEIPRHQRYVSRPRLAKIFMNEEAKSRRDRHIHDADVKYGYTLKEKEIVDHLRIHYATVNKAMSGFENK